MRNSQQRRLKHGRRLKEVSNSRERDRDLKEKVSRRERLVEKWAGNSIGTDKLIKLYEEDPRHGGLVAQALENQEAYLEDFKQRYDEVTISQNFQTTPEQVMRIIRIGTALSNRNRIFDEWALTAPDDSFYTIEKTYGSTKSGATEGESIYEKLAPSFGTEYQQLTLGTGNGTLTNFSATATTVPIIPFTVRIIINGVYTGVDNGSGGIAGVGIDATTSTVNYQTGAISLDTTSPVPSGFVVETETQWDSEQPSLYDSVGKVGISITRNRFEARPMSLEYEYSKMSSLTISKSGLGDIDNMLTSAIADEHAIRKDLRAFVVAKRIALSNPITYFDTDFASLGENSSNEHAQNLASTIQGISGTIFSEIKRGSINVMVAGMGALTYMRKYKNWVEEPNSNPIGGSFLAGTYGGIEVYGTPSGADGVLADNQILCTFKNKAESGDVALAFGNLIEMSASLDYPDFNTRGRVATVEDYRVVNSKLIRMLELKNLA